MTVTRSRLFVTQLEDRVVPTINVLYDFRFDTSGFFTNHPDRIATIRAAAADVGGALLRHARRHPVPEHAR